MNILLVPRFPLGGSMVSNQVELSASRRAFRSAIDDIASGIRKREIAFVFGWQDISQRYRRSRVGVFWMTINMGVLIGALGLIFGTLFRIPITNFLPFLASGIILWSFLSIIISEGCTTFIQAEGIILQIKLPLFTHLLRILWRNIIIFGHNIIILPLVMISVQHGIGWPMLLAPIGFVLLCINALWIALALSVICTRYRDMPLIVQNILQVSFYATPIMWTPETLPEGPVRMILSLNPFYHLVEIVRKPMLSEIPSIENWAFTIVLAIIGWLAAIALFGRYRSRIPYWL